MSLVDVERRGDVVVVRLGAGALTVDRLGELLDLLDELAGGRAGRALVTVGEGHVYSTGLDLASLEPPADGLATLRALERVLARVLTLPLPTLAAINGHAFAGGAMLAAAHDVRVMRRGRGYWCLPEVDLGRPLTEGMTALVAARLPGVTAHDAIVSGRRYGADDALAAGVVEAVADEDQLLDTAVALAAARADTAGEALGVMKRRLHLATVELLERGPAEVPPPATW